MIDVRGYSAIVPATSPVLAGTLPFTLVARGNSNSALPASLQHILKISYFATEADYTASSPSLTYTMPLAKVGLATIGVDYVPATPADSALMAYTAAPLTLGKQLRIPATPKSYLT